MNFIKYLITPSKRDWFGFGIGKILPRGIAYFYTIWSFINTMTNQFMLEQVGTINLLLIAVAPTLVLTIVLYILYLTRNYRGKNKMKYSSIKVVALNSALASITIATVYAFWASNRSWNEDKSLVDLLKDVPTNSIWLFIGIFIIAALFNWNKRLAVKKEMGESNIFNTSTTEAIMKLNKGNKVSQPVEQQKQSEDNIGRENTTE